MEAPRHINQLARELAAESYQPGPYRLIQITDPKRRVIAAAPIRDCVVHHAIHQALAPRLNRRFIEHSYACLPGRGSHRAVLRFRRCLQEQRHVLLLDIRRYFYSIDRGILERLLCRHLPEPPLQRLLQRVIESGAGLYQRPELVSFLGWERPGIPGRGLPIGNLTSQWWGNLYLDALDHLIKRELRVPRYQRYMDDLALFSSDKAQLEAAGEHIQSWLTEHRGLQLRDTVSPVKSTRQAHRYLGYEVSRVGIAPGQRMRRRAKELSSQLVQRPDDGQPLQSLRSAWMFGH